MVQELVLITGLVEEDVAKGNEYRNNVMGKLAQEKIRGCVLQENNNCFITVLLVLPKDFSLDDIARRLIGAMAI